MVDITTKSGFHITVSERILQDWRVVKALSRVSKNADDSTAVFAMSDVLALILGDDEERLYKHLLDEEGIVSSEAVMEEAVEIVRILGEHQKNSLPSRS